MMAGAFAARQRSLRTEAGSRGLPSATKRARFRELPTLARRFAVLLPLTTLGADGDRVGLQGSGNSIEVLDRAPFELASFVVELPAYGR
jgi:hypothetical protein